MHTKHIFSFISIEFYRQLDSSKHIIDQNDHITSGFRCKSTSEPSRGVINPHTWFFLFSTSTQSRQTDIFGGILFAKYCKISSSIAGYAETEGSYRALPCAYIEWTKLSRLHCWDESCLSTANADLWKTSTWERLSYHCKKEKLSFVNGKCEINFIFSWGPTDRLAKSWNSPSSCRNLSSFMTNSFQSACSTALCHSVDTFSTIPWPAEC